MTLKLTPDMLAAGYDFLRTTEPFRAWRLPDAEEVGLQVAGDNVLALKATGRHLYKIVTNQKNDTSSPFGPDTSAQSVRDQALASGASLK